MDHNCVIVKNVYNFQTLSCKCVCVYYKRDINDVKFNISYNDRNKLQRLGFTEIENEFRYNYNPSYHSSYNPAWLEDNDIVSALYQNDNNIFLNISGISSGIISGIISGKKKKNRRKKKKTRRKKKKARRKKKKSTR
jgi:hypothetical protein